MQWKGLYKYKEISGKCAVIEKSCYNGSQPEAEVLRWTFRRQTHEFIFNPCRGHTYGLDITTSQSCILHPHWATGAPIHRLSMMDTHSLTQTPLFLAPLPNTHKRTDTHTHTLSLPPPPPFRMQACWQMQAHYNLFCQLVARTTCPRGGGFMALN